ncbi:MAG: hypothetical protein ACI9OD_000804 [Limisphaerales bacterium]
MQVRSCITTGPFSSLYGIVSKFAIWQISVEGAGADDLDKPSGEAIALVKGITTEHGLGKFNKFMVYVAQVATSRREQFQWTHFVVLMGASTLTLEMPKR